MGDAGVGVGADAPISVVPGTDHPSLVSSSGSPKTTSGAPHTKSIDPRDVVTYLLRRHHLASAFELFQDMWETSSSSSSPLTEGRDRGEVDTRQDREHEGNARDVLESFFGDTERFPPEDVRRYSGETDVPLLQASLRTQQSRARVAEYENELAKEDLERVTVRLESSEREVLARRTREKATIGTEKRSDDPGDEAEYALEKNAFEELGTGSATTSMNLPVMKSTETETLNELVFEYCTKRGYKATALTLMDEARDKNARRGFGAGAFRGDWVAVRNSETGDKTTTPPPPDALRRVVRRANQIDTKEAAFVSLEATLAARSKKVADLETELKDLQMESTRRRDARVAAEFRCETVTKHVETVTKQLTTSRADLVHVTQQNATLHKTLSDTNKRLRNAEASAAHLESDLQKKMKEFTVALREERRKTNDTAVGSKAVPRDVSAAVRDSRAVSQRDSGAVPRDVGAVPRGAGASPALPREEACVPPNTETVLFSPDGRFGRLTSAHHEECTIRVLVESLDSISHNTLVTKRVSLLPLFARAILRAPIAATRADLMWKMLNLVKRPDAEFREGLGATVTEMILETENHELFTEEMFPVIHHELTGPTREERSVCAAFVLGTVVSVVSLTTRTNLILPALCDAFGCDTSKKSDTTRASILTAFVNLCESGFDTTEHAIALATTLVRDAARDRCEDVSEIAATRAVPAFAKTCVRGGCVTSAVLRGLCSPAFKEAITELAGGDQSKWRARSSLRFIGKALDGVTRERNSVSVEDGENAKAWCAETGCVLLTQLVTKIPIGDDAALLELAVGAIAKLCVVAGEPVTKNVIVPALDSLSSPNAVPVLLAAVLPHSGRDFIFLKQWLSGFVERDDVKGTSCTRKQSAVVAVRRAAHVLSRPSGGCEIGPESGIDHPPVDALPDTTNHHVFPCHNHADILDVLLRALAHLANDGTALEQVRAAAATLLGSAAEACPAGVAAEKALPTLGALAVNTVLAPVATGALLRLGHAHCVDTRFTEDVLGKLDRALEKQDIETSVAFVKATREVFTRPRDRLHGSNRATEKTRQRDWITAVATRVAIVATKSFGPPGDNSESSRHVAFGSTTLGAVRGLLEHDDDDDDDDDEHDAARRSVQILVPALRALRSDASVLDVGERALLDAMLRDEDWRLVQAASTAAAVGAARVEGARAAAVVVKKKEKSGSGSVSSAMRSMSRAMTMSGGSTTSTSTICSGKVFVVSELHTGEPTHTHPASPKSPGAPEIDFATLTGYAAPTVAETVETTTDNDESDETDESNSEKPPVLARGTSMSAKMFKSLPSAPKMAMPKSFF
jgi:hypothetical protein